MANQWIQDSLLDIAATPGKEEIDGLENVKEADPGEKDKIEPHELGSPKIGEFPAFEEFLRNNPSRINTFRIKVLYSAAVHFYETGVPDPSDEEIISSATPQWSRDYERKTWPRRDEKEINRELTEAWEQIKIYRQTMWERWVKEQKDISSETKTDIKTDKLTEEDSSGGWMRQWENSQP